MLTIAMQVRVAVLVCAGLAWAGNCAARDEREPLESFFLERPGETRVTLAFSGAGDKPLLRLVVGVDATAKQRREIEFENGDATRRQVAVFCPVSKDEMGGIIRATFQAGLLDDAFGWDSKRDPLSDRFLLRMEAGDDRRERGITGEGAAAFRSIVRKAVSTTNRAAIAALALVGG